jgi:hypothetical protein
MSAAACTYQHIPEVGVCLKCGWCATETLIGAELARLRSALSAETKLREEAEYDRAAVMATAADREDEIATVRERSELLAAEVEGADFPWPRETLVERIRAIADEPAAGSSLARLSAEARAEAAEARATRAEGALREAFPVGSWCAYCGQEIDKPESHPCPKCSSARRALAGEAQKEGTP